MPFPRRSLLAASLLAPIAAGAQTPAARFPMPERGRRPWAQQISTLRIGVLGGENEADRIGRYGGYARLIEETFGVPVRLFQASDYGGVVQAFAGRHIEIASMSPAAYAASWMESNGNVEPILKTQEADGSTSYIAVMYTRADSGITSLEQMRGRSMAWADPNSASGFLIPRAALRQAGVNPEAFFGRTGFAGGHEQAIVAVMGRQFDAGVTWASGVGNAEDGFNRGMLRATAEKGMINMRDIRIIWRSGPIENGPIVVRKDLPQSFKDDMVAFHLALPAAAPDIHRAVERGNVIGWVPARHEEYELFLQMRRDEAAERRRRN
ncbi:phosphate/phosphite/phosphonate ABC transporter substrate-binding protein [Falsiroseomonas stagni]|uniref:Phosphonate transport system substrate-binding protein n=1 Tax=Falsiroseomonas stagni DSM 19981 TaxID=1123062 RepID=A0A1I4BEI5_9PROT|nr:phosphate/phosphite/phosphonate ABC transporter substrate-binding protein [Falsiroseomonas stagni]SFK66421.1 phosphonate transport system substrate-binding protein [Falsiroseomonas stagni DSM 19981]